MRRGTNDGSIAEKNILFNSSISASTIVQAAIGSKAQEADG
jgi:hypothetical protein